ncbi:hypothetical protein BOTBODRAFT_542121 [Botryobasidium botryosum FD-172 SS1]|uniref:BTB domain-containing protein n=1 Tax=Botryobasidium botryosum (strain FD-172 SS1) TaxID=930990 RepID=A0A067MT58_BOTB1|nr:hypothetical protein BOTBODRAFT_542121 [Botryobasidium botryosum FD-172 SS1]
MSNLGPSNSVEHLPVGDSGKTAREIAAPDPRPAEDIGGTRAQVLTRQSKLPLQPTRDAEYYYPDGSIIILVETTLFKVHRSRLTRDSPIFESTLSLPNHPDAALATSEGRCDENPFVLHGEKAQRFRTLLLVLYGMPYELVQIFSEKGHLSDLIIIASIMHKYGFHKIEALAVSTMRPMLQLGRYPYLPPAEYLSLFDYSILADQTALRDDVLSIIRNRIMFEPTYAYAVIMFAMDRRHEEIWGRVLGLALYYGAIKGPTQWAQDSDWTSLPKDMKLLLHVSFSTLVDMKHRGIPWVHDCGDAEYCATKWLELLDQATTGGYGDFRRKPADFASWVCAVVDLRQLERYTPCHRAAALKYQNQANALVAGSWEFFEKLHRELIIT